MSPMQSTDSFWDAFWSMPWGSADDDMFRDEWTTYCMGGEL